MKAIAGYFLRGLLLFLPIAITISVLVWAFTGIDQIFRNIFHIKIPGLGVLATSREICCCLKKAQ